MHATNIKFLHTFSMVYVHKLYNQDLQRSPIIPSAFRSSEILAISCWTSCIYQKCHTLHSYSALSASSGWPKAFNIDAQATYFLIPFLPDDTFIRSWVVLDRVFSGSSDILQINSKGSTGCLSGRWLRHSWTTSICCTGIIFPQKRDPWITFFSRVFDKETRHR